MSQERLLHNPRSLTSRRHLGGCCWSRQDRRGGTSMGSVRRYRASCRRAPGRLKANGRRTWYVDGQTAEVRNVRFPGQQSAICAGVATHAKFASGLSWVISGDGTTISTEQLCRSVGQQPVLEGSASARVVADSRQRHLVCSPRALSELRRPLFRTRPPWVNATRSSASESPGYRCRRRCYAHQAELP